MKKILRILAGSEQPGGATCLFPIIKQLRQHSHIRVELLGCQHSAEVFRYNHVSFTDLGSQAVSDEVVQDLVIQNQPDLILTGIVGPIETGLDYRLIRAARKERVLNCGILDAWMNYRSRFADPQMGGDLVYLPDRVGVMDRVTIEEMVAEKIPLEHLSVTGHPFLSVVREKSRNEEAIIENRNSLGISSDEKLIIFVSEPIRFFYQGDSEHPGYDEFAAFSLACEAIAQLNEPHALIVKEHPRHSSLEVRDSYGNTRAIKNPQMDALDLILAADFVIGMSSTVLIYAFLAGRKVIVVQPGLQTDIDRNMLSRRGIVANKQSIDEILEAIYCKTDQRKILDQVRCDLGWGQRLDVQAAEFIQKLAATSKNKCEERG